MTDALELIAEARRRQEDAERECESLRWALKVTRRRSRNIINMVKRRPIEPPPLDAKDRADWDAIFNIVDHLAEVIADPHAMFEDEADVPMTHDAAKRMAAYWLQDMIEAAVKKARAE